MRGGCDRRGEPSQVGSFINLMGSAGFDVTLARRDGWCSTHEVRRQAAAAARQWLTERLRTLTAENPDVKNYSLCYISDLMLA
jgi:hypothetical protein